MGAATVSWTPDILARGFKIFYGTTTHSYSQPIDVGSGTSCHFSNLPSGSTYYFSVAGYNLAGESDFSGEEPYFVP